jgi:predicted CXXCH cytochrome family protein
VASVAQICRTCHVSNGALFDGSKHKLAFERHKWPECEVCHGKHAIEKPSVEMLGSTPGTLCADCHAKYAQSNPECNATAAHFREVLTTLDAKGKVYSSQTEQLAEHGLDVGPLQESLEEFSEGFVKARTTIHSFDRGTFDAAAAPANQALTKAQSWLEKATAEYRFRRNGLLASIAVMVFLAAILYLKIREISGRS